MVDVLSLPPKKSDVKIAFNFRGFGPASWKSMEGTDLLILFSFKFHDPLVDLS